ncbi:MAG TPA: AAA family ATPase [Steroidobacteraceae bacterium]|nr:AAA family ATPase [Steroidobacteraceae bacterium]
MSAAEAPRLQTDASHELEILLRSRIPLVVLESRDETRVLQMLKGLSMRLTRNAHTPMFEWTVTDGLKRVDVDLGAPQRFNTEPIEILKHIRATPTAGVYVLVDFHPYLADPIHVRLLKDICLGYEQVARTIVLLSDEIDLPHELEQFSARCELIVPDRDERRSLVQEIAQEWAKANPGQRVQADQTALDLLVENLNGLTTSDTRRLARKAIFDDGALSKVDLPGIMQAKYELLNRSGVLSYEHDTAKFADIGGLERLKEWLRQRKPAFDGGVPGLDPPKGLLLLGVQGCGKSLAARAAAGILSVPLLHLDFAAVYNKWHGESERNLRDTLRTSELMAPCVLWIDEIEKGIATGEGDSGTSRRALGTLLTWLAEKKAATFVVATANDIKALPPELIRKGRFDEIFFVDLPSSEVRREILAIHAKRRGLTLTPADVEALARASDGFSGAELEQAVVSALYSARASQQQPSAAHVLREIQATHPLCRVMAERIDELREWAADRTVPAD